MNMTLPLWVRRMVDGSLCVMSESNSLDGRSIGLKDSVLIFFNFSFLWMVASPTLFATGELGGELVGLAGGYMWKAFTDLHILYVDPYFVCKRPLYPVDWLDREPLALSRRLALCLSINMQNSAPKERCIAFSVVWELGKSQQGSSLVGVI